MHKYVKKYAMSLVRQKNNSMEFHVLQIYEALMQKIRVGPHPFNLQLNNQKPVFGV
jgi:hypothetical protein